jgi:26S proteasome regulatory subunit N2
MTQLPSPLFSQDFAAIVASKCFFHLADYENALRLALGAGEHFNINDKTEYVQCMTKQCIDQYIEQRIANCSAKPEEVVAIDPRLEAIIEKMFERCYNDGCYDQALGIALESRRLDHVRGSILKSGDVRKMLAMALSTCQTAVTAQSFRLEVLNALKAIHQEHANSAQTASDFTGLALCLQYLDDSQSIAGLLEKLVQGSVDDSLIAYQVAFDIVENGNMGFVGQVSGALPSKTPVPVVKEEGAVPAAEAVDGEVKIEGEPAATTPAETTAPEGAHADYWERLEKLQKILKGGFFVELNCDFAFRNNQVPFHWRGVVKAYSTFSILSPFHSPPS